MTRSELVKQLSDLYPELEPCLIEDAVSLFFFEIGTTLQRQNRVELRGFGTFVLRHRKKRAGRNPKTGEKVTIPPKWAPFFKAGKELKACLNQETFRPQLFQIDGPV